LEKARNVRPKELEARVRAAVRDECLGVSHDFAELVSKELYDVRIVPRLQKFRETGGTLRQLENDLRLECESFSPEMHAQMAKAGEELERRVTVRVKELLGESGAVDTRLVGGLFGKMTAGSLAITHTGHRMSGDITTLLTGVVSGSVAVAVGTISGGFGEALGIALLVGVVESGPVGWLIGAIGGLLATAGVLALGRERIREGVKDVPLPATALKLALWSSRYERLVAEGRKKCEESVRNSLADQLDQFSSRVSGQIWNRLRAIIGESQRPRSDSKN
jgi:hypothetical protein